MVLYKLFSAPVSSHRKLFRFLRPYRLSTTAVNEISNFTIDDLAPLSACNGVDIHSRQAFFRLRLRHTAS